MKLFTLTLTRLDIAFEAHVNYDNVEVCNAQIIRGQDVTFLTTGEVNLVTKMKFTDFLALTPRIEVADKPGARIQLTAIGNSGNRVPASFLISDILAIVPTHEEERPCKGACEILRMSGQASDVVEQPDYVISQIVEILGR